MPRPVCRLDNFRLGLQVVDELVQFVYLELVEDLLLELFLHCLLPRKNLQRYFSEPLSGLTDRFEFCKSGLRIVHRAFRKCSESTVRIQIDPRWIKELGRFTNSPDHQVGRLTF